MNVAIGPKLHFLPKWHLGLFIRFSFEWMYLWNSVAKFICKVGQKCSQSCSVTLDWFLYKVVQKICYFSNYVLGSFLVCSTCIPYQAPHPSFPLFAPLITVPGTAPLFSPLCTFSNTSPFFSCSSSFSSSPMVEGEGEWLKKSLNCVALPLSPYNAKCNGINKWKEKEHAAEHIGVAQTFIRTFQ